MNNPLPVDENLTATVYSVESARDNPEAIIITVSTNSSASPATLTNQLTQPLRQTLEEATDINPQVAFAIEATQRQGMADMHNMSDTHCYYTLCYNYNKFIRLQLPHHARWLSCGDRSLWQCRQCDMA